MISTLHGGTFRSPIIHFTQFVEPSSPAALWLREHALEPDHRLWISGILVARSAVGLKTSAKNPLPVVLAEDGNVLTIAFDDALYPAKRIDKDHILILPWRMGLKSKLEIPGESLKISTPIRLHRGDFIVTQGEGDRYRLYDASKSLREAIGQELVRATVKAVEQLELNPPKLFPPTLMAYMPDANARALDLMGGFLSWFNEMHKGRVEILRSAIDRVRLPQRSGGPTVRFKVGSGKVKYNAVVKDKLPLSIRELRKPINDQFIKAVARFYLEDPSILMVEPLRKDREPGSLSYTDTTGKTSRYSVSAHVRIRAYEIFGDQPFDLMP